MNKKNFLEFAVYKQILERLSHLSHISSPVILLGGDKGSGKTTLCKRFVESLSDKQTLAAYVLCTPTLSGVELRESIIERLFPQAVFNPRDPLSQTLDRIATQPCDIVLILDDGHEAPSDFLLDLWILERQLRNRTCRLNLTVIISALPKWCRIQMAVLQEQGVTAVELDMPILSLSDARSFVERYLLQRMGPASLTKVKTVTDTALNECYGRPQQLKIFAEKLMDHSKDTDVVVQPWQKISIGIIVVACVALIFSWLLPIPFEQTLPNLLTPVPKSAQLDKQPHAMPPVTPKETQIHQHDVKGSPPILVDAIDTAEEIAIQQADEQINMDKQEDNPQITKTIPQSAPLPEMTTQTSTVELIPQKIHDTQGTLIAGPDNESQDSINAVDDVATLEQTITLNDPQLQDPLPQGTIQLSNLEDATTQQLPHIEEKNIQQVDARLSDLSTQDAQHYMLQLIGVSQRAQAQAFIQEHQLQDSSEVYQISHDGKPFFVVMMGIYPSLADARDALEKLPPDLKKHKPWPKTVAQVRGDVQS